MAPRGVRESKVAPAKTTSRSTLLAQTIWLEIVLLLLLPPLVPLVPPVEATSGRSTSPASVPTPVPIPVPPPPPLVLVTLRSAVPMMPPEAAVTTKLPATFEVHVPFVSQLPLLLFTDQVGLTETTLLDVSSPCAVNVWLSPTRDRK